MLSRSARTALTKSSPCPPIAMVFAMIFAMVFAAPASSSLAAAATGPASPASPASHGGTVGVLVLREHGVGSASSAQAYVDRLMDALAAENGWSGALGKYVTRRAAAKTWIAEAKPHYGILSLGAFLDMRASHRLEVVGKAEVARAGGRQYHLISKTQTDLAGCKHRTLASDHLGDARFVEKVIGAGAFSLAEFTLIETRRPMQTVKKVIRGEAECALVDDAQLSALAKIEGGGVLRPVWTSKTLPPMVVVAFPGAPTAEKRAFKSALPKVCKGQGKSACAEVGIKALRTASASDYAGVIRAYGG